MSSTVATAVLSAILTCAVSITGAFLPVYFSNSGLKTAGSLCFAFASGAFFSLGMFHILPEAVAGMANSDAQIIINGNPMNTAFIIAMFGYLLVFFFSRVLCDDANAFGHCTHDRETIAGVGDNKPSTNDTVSEHNKAIINANCYGKSPSGTVDTFNSDTEINDTNKKGNYPGSRIIFPNIPVLSTNEYMEGNVKSNCVACDGKNWKRELKHSDSQYTLNNSDVEMSVPSTMNCCPSCADECKLNACAEENLESITGEMNFLQRFHYYRHESKCFLKYMFTSGAFYLLIALGMHSFCEGLITGMAHDCLSMWLTTAVIVGHKWAESFALTSSFMEYNIAPKYIVCLMTVFILSTPLGILTGMIFATSTGIIPHVANAFGAGTVIYIATELTEEVFSTGGMNRILKFIVYLCGICTVCCLTVISYIVE